MDSTARTHLHQAHDSLRHAAEAAHERLAQRLVGDDVRAHLRQAARHVLQAGMAVLDSADQRRAARTTTATHPPAAPAAHG